MTFSSPNLQSFQEWIQNHTFSPSEFEAFELCPFRFYAQSFLKISAENPWEVELTPSEVGQLMLEILETLLRLNPMTPMDLLIEEKFAEGGWTTKRPGLSPVLLEFQKKKVERTLKSFLEDRAKEMLQKDSLQPKFFEWSFGKETPPLLLEGAKNPIKIKGRIDRIDVDEKNKRFLVIDYKTGSTKITGGQILAGKSLQLPIYLLAVQKLLLPDYQPIGALYYHLSDMSKKDGLLHTERLPASFDIHPRSSSLIPPGRWDSFFEETHERIQNLVAKIRTGIFTSQSEPCTPSCPYQDICRVRSTCPH